MGAYVVEVAVVGSSALRLEVSSKGNPEGNVYGKFGGYSGVSDKFSSGGRVLIEAGLISMGTDVVEVESSVP